MATVKFAFKLLLVAFAACIVSMIGMLIIISSDIGFIYKVLIGVFFVAFTVMLVWNNAAERGEKDYRDKLAYKGKGFAAGAMAMLPCIALCAVYLIVTYRGWITDTHQTEQVVYLALYMVFMPYAPLLSCFVQFNPAMNIDFSQPAISFCDNITTPNAVAAPMFLLPVLVFVLVAGVAYLKGCGAQKEIAVKINELKSKNKENNVEK